jgi:hypothetical protein
LEEFEGFEEFEEFLVSGFWFEHRALNAKH